jgi:hypothetical protein
LLALLACCVAAMFLGTPPADAAKGSSCKPDVLVIGARGSGEKPNRDPGHTVRSFIQKLEHIAGHGAIGSEGLEYQAVGILDWKLLAAGINTKALEYEVSVTGGVASLIKAVIERADRCETQKLVLSGYSQGAEVVRKALPYLKKVADHVGAVVLFGDPQFDPHTWAEKGGTYSRRRHGVLGLPDKDFPKVFDHVVTYCRDGDLICQGFPNLTEGHKHYAPEMTVGAAVKVAGWLGLFGAPACHPVGSISAIIDDSGSMERNDPAAIRRAALELLITKPSSQAKELGAVEFGTDAADLFAPGIVAGNVAGMLGALGGLANDGAADGGETTNYNAAFEVGRSSQPQAGARIFLTDGGHNEGVYEDGHLGGPPTYVIGLNIGPAGEGSEEADLLGRIATETGGRYFPLVRVDGDDTITQLSRLQPTLNKIDALLGCQKIQVQRQQSFTSVGQLGAAISTRFKRRKALEVVASWATPGTNLDLVSAAARSRSGKVIADLAGRRRIKGTKKRRAKLVVSRVEGETFETVTVQRPKRADRLVVRFGVAALAAPVDASIQVRSVAPGAPPGTTEVGPAPAAGAGGGGQSGPLRRVLVVDNRVTNGMGMREDSTPARLTTKPWTFCTSRGCNIYGTERSSGGTYDAAVCQTTGERTTNGNDHDPSDDANPERFESSRYYGVSLSNGVFGYVSEVWIRAADRGGLGLPPC